MKGVNSRSWRGLAAAILLAAVFALPNGTVSMAGQPSSQNAKNKIIGLAHGALVLAGGGATIPEVTRRFIELGGGKACRLIAIPSATPESRLTDAGLAQMKQSASSIWGMDVTVLHAHDRAEADSEEFVKPLKQATAVWILGGDEIKLAKLYVGTRTEREIKAIADRGGVLGGTSAGAMVMAEFIDGGQDSDPNPFATRLNSFGLLMGTTIVPHWSERKLRQKVVSWLAPHRGTLGIAIDETAAAIVIGTRLEVVGSGHIGLYDGSLHDGQPYQLLSAGQTIDLKTISVY